MEVHERLIVDGSVGRLRQPLIHQDFKGLERYIERHNAYSTWESQVRCRSLATGVYGPDTVKARLFGTHPVLIALVVGGIVMIVVERWRKMRAAGSAEPQTAGRPLSEMTLKFAIIVGCAQVIAMWPGTSRSMITMIAALLLGFSPKAAAEFSFLLALPTLGAATAYDTYKHGQDIMQATGALGLAIGFFTSFVVAWIAVKSFLKFLTHHGMELFGWYRIALAGIVAAILMR
jgi:undecaprenyl-diphosphatase